MFKKLIQKADLEDDVFIYFSFGGKTFILPKKMDQIMLCDLTYAVDVCDVEDFGFVLKDSVLSLRKSFGHQIVCDTNNLPTLQKSDYPNTRINYLYRDGSNYKVHNSIVVSGQMTQEMIAACLDACDEGEYFIPSQVNLPEAKFEVETEDDTPWFELNVNDFEPTFQHPEDDRLTTEKLVEDFKMAAEHHWMI